MQTVKLGSVKEHSYAMRESLRALKTNLQFCGDDVTAILVTSSVPDEGKSTVTMDLARSLTESGKSVLVIDTDMRKSVLIGRLRAKSYEGELYGLSHYLSGQKKLDEVVYATDIKRLFMVFAGPSVPNPTEILEKKQKLVYTATYDYLYENKGIYPIRSGKIYCVNMGYMAYMDRLPIDDYEDLLKNEDIHKNYIMVKIGDDSNLYSIVTDTSSCTDGVIENLEVE